MCAKVIVKSLSINNLRNLKTVDVEPHPRLNFFIGENGAGKTSVLEALVVLAKGRSFRTGKIGALIGPEAAHFRVVTRTAQEGGGEQTVGIERSASEWSARRNREDVQQLSDLAVCLPLVILEPNSHLLVSGPPDGRRRFLDWGVFHVEPAHLVHWRRYARALKQRNAALRSRNAAVVSSLDPVLADLGERIHAAREQQCNALFGTVQQTLEALNPSQGSVELRYQRGWSEVPLRQALGEVLERDLERGATGPGPHRAEISINCATGPAKETLSRGEQKILATALLLSQASIMAAAGETPLLLLDDLASEFDARRLACVMEFGGGLGAQAWVTGTSLEPYPEQPANGSRVFHVEHGNLSIKTSR